MTLENALTWLYNNAGTVAFAAWAWLMFKGAVQTQIMARDIQRSVTHIDGYLSDLAHPNPAYEDFYPSARRLIEWIKAVDEADMSDFELLRTLEERFDDIMICPRRNYDMEANIASGISIRRRLGVRTRQQTAAENQQS